MVLMMQTNSRGRPLTFSRQDLIKAATELFWQEGYHAISLNKVAHKMGLNRSSLYNSFKTKEDLFYECLEYYSSKSPTVKLTQYKPGQSVGALLYEVFDEICALRSKDKQNKGCLIANTFHELGNKKDALGKKLLKRNHQKIESMTSLMRHAIEQKELPNDTDATMMAHIILSFLNGLNVRAKSGASVQELKDMSHLFLDKIGFTKK